MIFNRQEIFLLQILASGSCPDIYHNELYKLIAPLTTFCSLYNLFLFPILDEEFLKGEAIFSKMDLIKISSILKDACIGMVDLMHPDLSPSMKDTLNDSFIYPTKTRSANLEPNTRSVPIEIKIKSKSFTALFLVWIYLISHLF